MAKINWAANDTVAAADLNALGADVNARQPNLAQAAVQTANFTAAINTYYPVDATSGNITVTIPASTAAGQQIAIKKSDASVNLVTFTGNLNGVAGTSFPMRLQNQGKVLIADTAGGWNIAYGDLSLATLDVRFAAKAEHFRHPLAGATTGMTLPTTSASGHTLTWTKNPTSNGSTGAINGRGGFWADPSAAPSAVYMTASLAAKPRWGRMRFAALPQTTTGGTACIAIPSKAAITAPLTMAAHYRSTRSGWAFSVWDNGAEVVLAQGNYSPALVGDANRPVEYELAFRIDGSTATFRTADGVVQAPVTDARIASLGGNFLFAESYAQATTDDIIAILNLEGGDTPPVGLLDAAAVTSGDLAQQLSYKANAAAVVTRSVPYCFEMCQQAVSQAANTAIQLKRPFRVPIKPTRFRFHFANRVQLSGAFVTGTAGNLVGLRVALGKPTVNATTGEPTGAWASPIEVMTTTNVTAGAIQSTPWIDPATHSMNAGDMMFLGYSFTTSASSPQIAYNGGLSWQSNTLADLMSTTATGTRANNSSFLQVIMEIEHTDAGANHLLMVTNSLPGPSAGGVYDNYGELGTLAQIWAMRTRNFASSIGVAGSYAAAYNSVNTKWQIFDNFNIPYVPDVVLYYASASSDVADSTSDTTTNDIKTNVINMIKAGKTKFPTARQWLTDIPPRAAFSGANTSATTNEGQRHKMNQWLHMLPVQTEQCLNVDALFTDWGTGAGNPAARLRPVFTPDDTHGSRIFHDYAASGIPLGRKVF